MPASSASSGSEYVSFEQRLAWGREILLQEANAVGSLAPKLGEAFCRATDLISQCAGSVIVSGIGKAGLIGQKLVATLASTGTRSHFLHPAEALHGDLGRIHRSDIVLLLSFSGESEEVLRLLPSLLELGTPLVAMTGQPRSTLARHATLVLELGALEEACDLGLAPSCSTTAMLALGDALALVLSRMRRFTPHDFLRFHPGGSLGRKLTQVDDLMRPIAECRVARMTESVRSVFVSLSRPGRRTGAIMLVDQQSKLTGIFTDSDLARLLESGREDAINEPMELVMTRHPKSILSGAPLSQAWEILGGRKLSELPVVNEQGEPVGLIDITDLLALASPRETLEKKLSPVRRGPHSNLGNKSLDSDIVGELPAVIPFPGLSESRHS